MTVLKLILLFVFLSISAMVKSQEDTTIPQDDTTTADDTTTEDDTTSADDTTTEDDTTTVDDTTVPSVDTTTGSPSNCECIGSADNVDINRCDNPNGNKKCNVRNNQTCPDMFCDKMDRCFSVTACPDVAIPDKMPCEKCTCMDKQDENCHEDPQGQCNLCDQASPRKICRVDPDSKCVDKYCNSDRNRCYAVSACGCDKNKPTTK